MAVELRTNVIIGGKTDGSFDALAGKIASIAAAIDAIGGPLREFGSEALDTYKDYETYMLEAKGAMSANYSSAALLEKEYAALQEKAQEWAASTIFHTDDVAKAVSEAAHAGWSYGEMLEGIPSAMLLAQAGNIDLSSGLDYLIKTINGTGTAFSESETLVDQWVMAANSSATTVSELGQAMTKLGSTARFGDSNAEILALLGTLANAGVVGTEAGTLLRNTMIRLIAPTDKASAAMDILGASAEEIEAVLADSTITKAAKELEAMGFSAYDAQGSLKPMIQIFHDLHDTLDGLTEERQNQLLSAIFPTRTITGAKNILDALEGLDQLFEQINDSFGYAQNVADTQTSGLMGAEERMLSKWEEFKRSVGEDLAPMMENAYGFIGGIIDKLNSLSPEAMATIEGACIAIAGLGSIGTGASIALSLLHRLGGVGIGLTLGAAAVGALVGHLNKMHEIDLEGSFGQMYIDIDNLKSHVEGVNTVFTEQKNAVSEWTKGVETAQEKYEALIVSFSEHMLSDVLKGKTLGKKDIDLYEEYTDDIVGTTQDAVENSEAASMAFFNAILGDPETLGEIAAFNDIRGWLQAYYADLEREASQIGENIHNLLTKKLNGQFTEDDRLAVQKEIDRLNAIQAQIANGAREDAYQAQLYKATRLGWDSVSDFLQGNKEAMDESLQDVDDFYAGMYAKAKRAYEYARSKGEGQFSWTDENGVQHTYNVDDTGWANFEAYFRGEHEKARAAEQAKYSELARTLFDSLMNDSDYAALWKNYKGWEAGGEIGRDVYGLSDYTNMDWSDYTDDELRGMADEMRGLQGISGSLINALKGFESDPAVAGFIGMLRGLSSGIESIDSELTSRAAKGQQQTGKEPSYEDINMQAENLEAEIDRFGWKSRTKEAEEWVRLNEQLDKMEGAKTPFYELPEDQLPEWFGEYWAWRNGTSEQYQAQQAAAQQQAEAEARTAAYVEQGTKAYQDRVTQMQAVADVITDHQSRMAELSEQSEQYAAQIDELTKEMANTPPSPANYKKNQLQQEIDELTQKKAETDKGIEEAQAAINDLQSQLTAMAAEDIVLQIDDNADEVASAIQAAADGPYDAHVTVIYDDDGFTPSGGGEIHIAVIYDDAGGPSGGSTSTSTKSSKTSTAKTQATTAYNNLKSTVKSSFASAFPAISKLFEEGGRSDVPAIFGEAGPEWAIPEEHSDRTAELLNAAREASGFSWNELIARYGGLNGRSDGVVVNIGSYAPVITAQDSRGVEQKLIEDKERLKRLVGDAVRDAMERNALHDAIEVYA